MFVEAVRELSQPSLDGEPQQVDPKKIANLRVEHRALYDRMVSSWNTSSSLIPAGQLRSEQTKCMKLIHTAHWIMPSFWFFFISTRIKVLRLKLFICHFRKTGS